MRVFLVDGQPVFREGLKHIISSIDDWRVVGEASSYENLTQAIQQVELFILDGEVDSIAFLDALEKVREKGRAPYVLILTNHAEEQHAFQLIAAGASGYMHKTEAPDAVLSAIRRVGKGGRYIPNDLAEKMIFAMNGTNGRTQLSAREYQVLYLIASGLCATEIANHLALSVKTVSTYRCRLLEKLQLKNNAELMKYALKKSIAA
jgi:two-component system invasion response regulator UvrY